MDLIWIALAGGAAAFPHCVGMCGGFAIHLVGEGRPGSVLARQLLWHLGRTTTYVFLGALAGFAGSVVSLPKWPAVRDVPGYLAGAVMIVMGLLMLGVWRPRRQEGGAKAESGLFASVFVQFMRKPTATSALALGLANGFLPCPITLAFLAVAAGSASVLMGMGIMAAMGAGTVWSLLIVGMTGQAIKVRWRQWGTVGLAIVLIAMGSWTVLRKANVLPPLPGMHDAACCQHM